MTSDFGNIENLDNNSEFIELPRLKSGRFKFYRVRIYGGLHFVKKAAPEYENDLVTIESLRKEFMIGYGLNHPSIVRYMRFVDNAVFEEFIEGESLRQMLDNNDPRLQDNKFLKDICVQTLRALDYLHSNGIVHLDIKPENIMITRIGNRVKIVDLGASYSGIHDSTPGYTPGYQAPEQKSGLVNNYTDIYQTGELINELSHKGRHSKKWRKFIDKCTAQDHKDRFATCGEALTFLKRREPFTKKYLFSVIAVLCIITAVLVGWLLPASRSAQDSEVVQHKTVKDTVVIKTVETEKETSKTTPAVNYRQNPVIDENRSSAKESSSVSDEITLRRKIEKDIMNLFERHFRNAVSSWPHDEQGISADYYNDYCQMLRVAFNQAEAYGNDLSKKYPEYSLMIANTVNQTSATSINMMNDKYIKWK